MKQRFPYNILLLALTIYLGAFVYGNITGGKEKFLWAMEPNPIQGIGMKAKTPVSHNDHRIVSEQHLLAPTPKKKISKTLNQLNIEKPPTAGQDLGLKLLGTVIANNPETRVAVIDDRKTQKQKILHEGDPIGQVVIKRILRQTVIISTDSGDFVLNMNFEGGEKGTTVIKKSKGKKTIEKGKRPRRAKRIIKRIGTRDRKRIKRRPASEQARVETAPGLQNTPHSSGR